MGEQTFDSTSLYRHSHGYKRPKKPSALFIFIPASLNKGWIQPFTSPHMTNVSKETESGAVELFTALYFPSATHFLITSSSSPLLVWEHILTWPRYVRLEKKNRKKSSTSRCHSHAGPIITKFSESVRESGEADRQQNDGGTDFTIAEWISSSDQEATECAQTPEEKALLTAHIPPPQDNSSVLILHIHSQGWQALQRTHTHCKGTHREYQLRGKEGGQHSNCIRRRLCTQFGEWKRNCPLDSTKILLASQLCRRVKGP